MLEARRRTAAAALLAVAVPLAGCGGSSSADAAKRAVAEAPADPAVRFRLVDEAAERGLTALNHCGDATTKRYMVEEIGQGCALFDMDGDGDLDAYLVDGCSLKPPRDPEETGNRRWTVAAASTRTTATAASPTSPTRRGRGSRLCRTGSGRRRLRRRRRRRPLRHLLGAQPPARNDGRRPLRGRHRRGRRRRPGAGAPAPPSSTPTATATSTSTSPTTSRCRSRAIPTAGEGRLPLLRRSPPRAGRRAWCRARPLLRERRRRHLPRRDADQRDRRRAELLPRRARLRPRRGRRLDLYVANDSRGNHLFDNDGHGDFTEVADLSGCAVSEAWPAGRHGRRLGDFDGDLDPDLFCHQLLARRQHRSTRTTAPATSST